MKNFSRVFFALVVFILLSATHAQSQSPTEPNFDALRQAWIHNLESQNLDGSFALNTSDATFTNPDGTHVTGDALRTLYKTVFASFHAKISMTPRTHIFSGTLAYDAGSYAEDLTQTANGALIHTTGDYLTLYRWSQSSGWLIVEQVWTQAATHHAS